MYLSECAAYFKQLSAYAWNGISVVSVPPSGVHPSLSASTTEQNEDDVEEGVQDTLELSWVLKHIKSFNFFRINHSK